MKIDQLIKHWKFYQGFPFDASKGIWSRLINPWNILEEHYSLTFRLL